MPEGSTALRAGSIRDLASQVLQNDVVPKTILVSDTPRGRRRRRSRTLARVVIAPYRRPPQQRLRGLRPRPYPWPHRSPTSPRPDLTTKSAPLFRQPRVDPGCTKPGVDAPAVVRTISAITTRLLDAYAQGLAGGQHPAVDNLQQLHIPGASAPIPVALPNALVPN